MRGILLVVGLVLAALGFAVGVSVILILSGALIGVSLFMEDKHGSQ